MVIRNMDKRQEIESIASRYDLDVDFVQQLHDKVTDKENFARAVKMFVDGTLPFAVATGDAPINVASIRHDVAVNLLELRKMRADKVKEQVEMQRRIVEYYNGCRHVTMTHKGNKSIQETVFNGYISNVCDLIRVFGFQLGIPLQDLFQYDSLGNAICPKKHLSNTTKARCVGCPVGDSCEYKGLLNK